jgi:hypothetical protein
MGTSFFKKSAPPVNDTSGAECQAFSVAALETETLLLSVVGGMTAAGYRTPA